MNMDWYLKRGNSMKILIIGSTQYLQKFIDLKNKLEKEKHIVKTPIFDDNPLFNELELCEYNRDLIKWADKIYLIWDGRSVGAIFDFGMLFALEKPLIIEYIEPKTITGVIKRYAEKTKSKTI